MTKFTFPVTEEDMGEEDMGEDMGEDMVGVMAIVVDMDIVFVLAMEEADTEVDLDLEGVDTEGVMDMEEDISPVATDMEVMATPLIGKKVTKEPEFIDIDIREGLEKTKLWKKSLKPSICW